MKRWLAIAVLLFLPAQDALAGEIISGHAKVVDGDSLEIGEHRIRLEAIDAPEYHQACVQNGRVWACGKKARTELERMVGDGNVRCEVVKRDVYERAVSYCYVRRGAKEVELNREMVAGGWAFAYRHYSTKYVGEEEVARKARIGIWDSEVAPPWDWRQAQH